MLAPQRYTGLPTQATTQLVLQPIIATHAGDAAFLWQTRSRAVRSPRYALRDLARLDERVEAHLQGLQVAGEAAWPVLEENLAQGQPGAAFAAAAWAVRCQDRARFDAVIACAEPSAVVSACAWHGQLCRSWLLDLLQRPQPELRALALRAAAASGIELELDELRASLVDAAEPLVQANAAHYVGERRVRALRTTLEQLLHQASMQALAVDLAWSLCLFDRGHRGAHEQLRVATLQGDARAADMLARCASPATLVTTFRALLAAQREATALQLVAASGLPVLIDEAMALLARPELARLVGLAVSQATGADLTKLDLDQVADPELDVPDLQANLPLPAAEKLVLFWQKRRAELHAQARYLSGAAIGQETLEHSLRTGSQPERRAAALERALSVPDVSVFNTSQPGFVQAKLLLGWS